MIMNLEKHLTHPIFQIVQSVSNQMGIKSYVVGGWVRDIILNRESKDIDIVCLGSGIELANEVAKQIGGDCNVSVFKNFGTAMINFLVKDYYWQIEFVGARKESYNRGSRKPIVEDGTLEDDQNRRDFTINAMAISLNEEDYGELIDPFNGLKDIENGIIQTPLNPDITFSDDPLRMLRAIRFATQLNFSIHNDTFDAIARNAYRIEILSGERIIEEVETEEVTNFAEIMPATTTHEASFVTESEPVSSAGLNQEELFAKLQNYKKLLDNGLILQGEYDAFKKEILSQM